MAAVLGQGRPDVLLLAWIAVVFVSILVHELGHAVTLRAFGDAPRITLYAFGGLTHPTKTLPVGKDVAVLLAGSVTQILLLGLPAYVYRASFVPTDLNTYRWWIVLSEVVWVSVGWAVLNLVPMLPLDGGLLARRVLVHRLGGRGEIAALIVSIGTASAGALWAFLVGQPYLGFFALFFAGWNVVHLYRKLDDRQRERIGDARRLVATGERRRAEELLREATSGARTHAVRADASEALAWMLVEDGRLAEAREVAGGIRPDPAGTSLLDGYLNLLDGRTEEGATKVVKWWIEHPSSSPGAPVIRELGRPDTLTPVLDRLLAVAGDDATGVGHRLQYELHEARLYGASVAVGMRLFEDQRAPAKLVAYNVACGMARDGHLGLSLDWLDRAVESGWDDARQILEDDDLAPIRNLPRFDVIMGRLR